MKSTPLYPVYRGVVYAVPGTPLLYIDYQGILVLADLHLGYEEALARGYLYTTSKNDNIVRYVGAVIVPKRQLKKVIEYLDKAFSLLDGKIKKVVVNGDLKHAFDRLLRQERIEVKTFLDYLLEKKAEIILVRGNHDNYLPLILKDYGLELIKQYETTVPGIGKVLFTHGHYDVNIDNYDLVIVGHEHPAIKCLTTSKNPAILLVNTSIGNHILVLPAAGAYQAGTTISLSPENYLSPIIRKYGVLEEAELITWVETKPVREYVRNLLEDIKDIISARIITIDELTLIYLRFKSLLDALMICRL